MNIESVSNNIASFVQPNIDKLSAAYPSKPMGASSSALKGSLETQEMIQADLAQMMKEITPYLGQNIDIEA